METLPLDAQALTLIALGLGGLGLLGLLGLLLMLRRQRAATSALGGNLGQALERLAASQSELAGRLAAQAESQAAAQARLAEGQQALQTAVVGQVASRLQAQERAVSQALDNRLAEVDKKLHQGLETTRKTTTDTLHDLRERLAVIDRAQKNIADLSGQVVGLREVLSNKQARGAFGEVQLHDLVGAILPPSAFDFQVKLSNDRRVDCLIRLPMPPGPIAVDAKFPLESYHALRIAEDDTSRTQAGRTFSADVIKHVRDIAERYIIPGETAESALMFLPSEAVYAELHASFPNVVEESYRRRVWIVSPTTLMATLNTVRAVLKDARIREEAKEIQRLVGLLLGDVERLDDRVGNLDKHFDQTRRDIDLIKTSTGKIASRGSRILDLQLGHDDDETPAHEALPKADGG
ncbi:DNA recombination protein RmuC [Roseospirillum parvum]|uniref:DNA recombination protein RmuC homolog n=1 Tax=Roseospirillum parvum TaxID=83401 RepID=A0A1G8FTW5_9PROT|nr:DNA recombination protein RmuC [Roseospirillum parvum]SDH85560.1 DNA recombination protein RmuC [Roseospirillum parvum]